MRVRCLGWVTGLLVMSASVSFALTVTPTPNQAPIAVRMGSRIYKLRSFKTFANPKKLYELAQADSPWDSVARFSITENGRPAPWRPVELSVSDGQGKKWNLSHWSLRKYKTEHEFVFGLRQAGKHWRDYSRPILDNWNMRVEFSRSSDFMPHELWTVKNVPVPLPGQNVQKGALAEGTCNGVALQLLRLVPADEDFRDSLPLVSDKTGATLVLQQGREGLRADLVTVIDDRGRTVRAELLQSGSGGCVSDPTERYHFEFANLAAGARSINLTFAIHESEFVQFKVKPTTPVDLANGPIVAVLDSVVGE